MGERAGVRGPEACWQPCQRGPRNTPLGVARRVCSIAPRRAGFARIHARQAMEQSMSHNKARRGRKPESPRDVTPVVELPSNAIGFWAGLGITGSLMFAAYHLDVGSRSQQFSCLAFFPLAVALAELRSGYAWSNVDPGSRGVSRTESPWRYWFSVTQHLLIACILTLIGLLATFTR